MDFNKIIKIILAILSLVCLLDMPYGYYQLYRFIAVGIFSYLAYIEREDKGWMIIWIISALLIQPFYKVALGRFIWNIVDVIWAILLIFSIFNRKKTL
jgi:hypothetical protein